MGPTPPDQLSLDLPAAPTRLPTDLRPMLPRPCDEPFDDPDWLFEPSWDGLRVLAHVEGGHLRLVDPRGRDVTGRFPDLLGTIDAVTGAPAVVDGQITIPDESGMPDPGALRQRLRPSERARRAHPRPATLLANDLLVREGRALLREPLSRRRRHLTEALAPGDRLVIVPAVVGDGLSLFEAVEAQGLPAMLARRSDSPYLPGVRSDLWRRVPTKRTFEAVVGGYEARPTGTVALLLGAWARRPGDADRLIAVATVEASAGNDMAPALERALRRLEDPTTPFARGARAGYRWVRPELVVGVEHRGWLEGRLIDARLIAVRDELEARDCRLPRPAGPAGPDRAAPGGEVGGRPVLALLQRLPLGD